MNDSNKATIYYKKNNKEILLVKRGVSDLKTFKNDLGLLEEEKELLFGTLVVDYDECIFLYIQDFYISEENGNLKLKIKEDSINNLKKYL